MAKSTAQKQRDKAIREGKLDPSIKRNEWHRKPQTQVVRNERKHQSQNACRTKIRIGA
jgi:hypothetical protein